ncbi:MAG: hypothetical protein Q9209_007215 [Squamulea sp. 1 TL-2023]
MSRYGYPTYSRRGYYIVDYDSDSDSEDDMYEYEMVMRTRRQFGSTIPPPTVCHSGCHNTRHRMPMGALPERAHLGHYHQCAADEGICLTHVTGGCFEGGICDRLNYCIGQATVTDLGCSGDMHTRQLVRIAAGLPAGPAERPPPPGSRPTMGVPRYHGRDEGYGGDRQRRGGAASRGRAQQGGPSGPSRRPRGPDAFEEGGLGAGDQGPSGDVIYPDEVEEPEDGPVSSHGGAPQGGRRRAAADHGMDGRSPGPRMRGGPAMGMSGSRYGGGGSGEMERMSGPHRGNRGPWRMGPGRRGGGREMDHHDYAFEGDNDREQW